MNAKIRSGVHPRKSVAKKVLEDRIAISRSATSRGSAIIGRDEQIVGVFVREVAVQTGEQLLDHEAHRAIRRMLPAVERNMDQRFRM
jgi:hypothetical protein